ncbi:MAG: hypothetical protein ACRC5T_10050 [Cetobacterium sp.]
MLVFLGNVIYKKYEDYRKESFLPIFIFIVLSIPFIFLGTLKIVYCFLPGVEVGKISDWISFGGTYLGAIVAIGGIAYQIKSTERNRAFLEEKQLKQTYNFLKYYLSNLKNNFNLVKSNLKMILKSPDSSKVDVKKLFSEEKMILSPRMDDYFLEQIKKVLGEEVGTELIELYDRTYNFEEILKVFGEGDFFESNYLKKERRLFCEVIENYSIIISWLENLGYDLKFSEDIQNLIKEIKNKRININKIENLIMKINSIECKKENSPSFDNINFPEKDKVFLMSMVEKINMISKIDNIEDEKIKMKFLQLFYLYAPEFLLDENEQLYIPNFQIYEEFVENIINQISKRINEIDNKYGLK